MTQKTAAAKSKPAPKKASKNKAAAAPAEAKTPKSAPKTGESAPRSAPLATPSSNPGGFMQDLGPLLLPENRAALETLSMNLARAALTAQGAFAEAALRQADRPQSMNADPFGAGPAMSEVLNALAAQPDKLLQAQADLFSRYMDLWQSTARRFAVGEEMVPVVSPAAGDRRFNDPEWEKNPLFDVIKQSYLLSSNWLNDLVSSVQDVEPQTKRRAEFFMKMMTDAFSPSNFLISNPAAWSGARRPARWRPVR